MFLFFSRSRIKIVFSLLFGLSFLGSLILLFHLKPWEPASDAHQSLPQTETDTNSHLHPRLRDLAFWKRPPGPPKIGLQIGHWQAAQAPDEQKGLRKTTGTSAAGYTEWETMLALGEATKILLEKEGYQVELLPVTIPPNYWADAFISLHADGNENTTVSGYKAAAPRFDYTQKGTTLANLLNEEYGRATNLPYDPEITRQMRGYYAFNWRRYEHSIHPFTAASILEAGFLTNPRDRNFLVKKTDVAAEGIASGIIRFVREEGIGQ